MEQEGEKKGFGKTADLLETLKGRKVPLVGEEASINDMIDAFVGSEHSRVLYVVDDHQKLKGVVSLGNLVRHVLFLYHDQPVDGRSLVRMAISEKATDFIEHEPVCVRVSDDVEDVLARMIRRNIKEIAVVDEQNRVVGDVTMVDLLGYYQCYKDAAESD